jgi:hypothetical protein
MAVKIDQIGALQETSSLLTSYASSVRETVGGVNTKISAKFEGQQAEALSAYLSTINEMTSKVFIDFPTAVSKFSAALSSYHDSITGEGFSNKVRSSKPGVEEDYCVKVTGDEAITMEEQVAKVKTTFEKILEDSDAASAIGGDPLGTVTKALGTFNEDLNSRVDAIKTTRSNLEQANKSVITELSDVLGKIQECKAAMTSFCAITDGTNGFSAATVLSLIQKGKLTADNMSGTLNGIQKKNDAKAMEYVLLEKYEEYFALDPSGISELPNQMLVLKLSDTIYLPEDRTAPIGQPQFEAIINQLLKSGKEVHIEGHLANMMKASDTLALQYATLLAGGTDSFGHSLTFEEQKFLEAKLAKMNAMGSLYMTLHAIDMPDELLGSMGDSNIKATTTYKYELKNLKLAVSNDFSFGIETTTKLTAGGQSKERTESKEYMSSFYTSVIPSKLAEEDSKLYKIQKERQAYIQNLAKSQLIATVGIFNPAIGSGLQFLDALAAENNGGTVKSASALAQKFMDKSNPYYQGMKNSAALADSLLSAMTNYGNMVAKWKEDELEIEKEMISLLLDKGGRAGKEKLSGSNSNVFICENGLPTVESIQRLNELNARGISGYEYTPIREGDATDMNKKIIQVKELLTKPDKPNEKPKELTKAQEYVMGIGGHKLGDEGCSPSQVNNALEEFANQAGMTKEELYDYIKQIPDQKK